MTDLITEDITVPSDPGIEIYVRNKRPPNLAAFSPERTLLFVHGSTYPAHTGFDLPLGGQSCMDFIAARGFDVYCLDLRDYFLTRVDDQLQIRRCNLNRAHAVGIRVTTFRRF